MFSAAPIESAFAAERTVRVMIQAQPRFENLASHVGADGSFEVGAQLLDDTGAPLGDVDVGVASTSSRNVGLSACNAAPARGRIAGVRTDPSGRLCVRVSGAPPEGSVELTFAGNDVHLPVTTSVGLQPAPALSSLTFEAPSLELDLDQDSVRLKLRLADAPGDDPLPPIELELHDGGRSVPLEASEWSRSGDTLSFAIDARQLGRPGPARLVARRKGTAASAEAIALRVASVQLEAEVLDVEAEVAHVRVWTASRAGAVPSGWVEALRQSDQQTIGSSPFDQGTARLDLAREAAEVALHYRSDDPWWRPAAPVVLSIGSSLPRAPRRWPWLALLAPIGYVCLRSLQRPAPREAQRRPRPVPRGPVLAGPAPAVASGWGGHVFDAHDGSPIAGARIQAVLPSFRDGDASHLAVVADENGWFELPALQHPLPEGARLRVWAPMHSEVERPLPPQGRVNLALISRRRAVLRRLVRWARSVGTPWVRGTEPTPGEIADVAMRRGDPRIARWAEDVQAAAFGEAPVDETLEASLRSREPAWHETPSKPQPRDD